MTYQFVKFPKLTKKCHVSHNSWWPSNLSQLFECADLDEHQNDDGTDSAKLDLGVASCGPL